MAEDYSTSIMVALLPTTKSWSTLKMPHLTLIYAGDTEDVSPTLHNELLKQAVTASQAFKPMTLKVTDVEEFGTEEKGIVDVLRIEKTPELVKLQQLFDYWNLSSYPFNPHCTIGPAGESSLFIPESLRFNKIVVSWGNANTVYNL